MLPRPDQLHSAILDRLQEQLLDAYEKLELGNQWVQLFVRIARDPALARAAMDMLQEAGWAVIPGERGRHEFPYVYVRKTDDGQRPYKPGTITWDRDICDVEPPQGYQACTRERGHEGPCAMDIVGGGRRHGVKRVPG